MLDKQTIIEKILQVKFNPNQVVTLIVDGCTVTVKAMSDELLYFRYKVDEQEKFTSLLDFSLKDGYVNFYYSGEEGSQLAKACVLDILIPTLYELVYNPPKELHYVTLVRNFKEFEEVVRKIYAESKYYQTVRVDCSYDMYYDCRFVAEDNRLTFCVDDELVAGVNLSGEPNFSAYSTENIDEFINATLQIRVD